MFTGNYGGRALLMRQLDERREIDKTLPGRDKPGIRESLSIIVIRIGGVTVCSFR